MADETRTDEQQDIDYIAAIKELRDKSVPKEQYAQLKEENSRLIKSLINGETLEDIDKTSEPDIAELRKQLFDGNGELNNLEYVTKALELRNALIASGKPDPFLPVGHKVAIAAEDIEAADRVAKVLQECIDYADGDSAIFTNELQRVMKDTAPSPPPRKQTK